jgi:hypothetical protein
MITFLHDKATMVVWGQQVYMGVVVEGVPVE